MDGKRQFTGRELLLLIAPLILDSLLSILIGIADTMMVSTNGEAAISGVSLVDSISMLLINLFSAFSTGGSVVVSQYLGRSEDGNARLSARNLVYVSLLAALLIVAVVLPLRGAIIDLVFGELEMEVRRYTDDYFVPILLSYPFLALYTSFTALSRSESRSVRTLAVSALMNVVNIAGNAILIFIFHLGTRGAGLSSLFSRILGAVLMFLLLRRPSDRLSLQGIAKGPVSLPLIRKIASIAIPSGIESSAFQLGKIVVASLVASLGTSAIAINALVGNFNVYSNIPGFGLSLAAITIIGQCRGKGNFKDIYYYTRLLFTACFICTFLIDLPCFILAPRLVGLYSLEPASILRAVPMTRLCLVMCTLVWPPAFLFPNILKAAGDVKFILFSVFGSMWVFRVGSAWLMVKVLGMGVEAIWYAMYLDWGCRGLLFTSRFLSGRWKAKEVI